LPWNIVVEKILLYLFLTLLTAADLVDDVGDVMDMSLLRAITGALSLAGTFLRALKLA